MIVMRITNVVARAKISGFEKSVILDGICNAEYRPNGFPAICFPAENGATVSLFDSGKMTSKGAKSTDFAVRSIYQHVERIKKLGTRITIISNPTISLIVSHVSFGRTLDIKRLQKIAQFKKKVSKFNSIQLAFPHNINVQAYVDSLVISGCDTVKMIMIAKRLKRYTVKG